MLFSEISKQSGTGELDFVKGLNIQSLDTIYSFVKHS